ncbi:MULTISPECIES: c-type cytochrome [Sphingomonas]|nr:MULTISPECIES: c-type cytochrome [Sphingomonas]MDX3884622.1 c-type cytochrome [Sphingomonas sp.]
MRMGFRKSLAAGIAATLSIPAFAAPLPRPPAFAMCAACHKTQPGASSPMGPNLWGVGGRKPASLTGYTFSPALQKLQQPWTRATLIAFITDPRKIAPGNRMAYAGQKDPAVAAALADYMLSLK